MPSDIGYGAMGVLGPKPTTLVTSIVLRYFGLGPGGISRMERDWSRIGQVARVSYSEQTKAAMAAHKTQLGLLEDQTRAEEAAGRRYIKGLETLKAKEQLVAQAQVAQTEALTRAQQKAAAQREAAEETLARNVRRIDSDASDARRRQRSDTAYKIETLEGESDRRIAELRKRTGHVVAAEIRTIEEETARKRASLETDLQHRLHEIDLGGDRQRVRLRRESNLEMVKLDSQLLATENEIRVAGTAKEAAADAERVEAHKIMNTRLFALDRAGALKREAVTKESDARQLANEKKTAEERRAIIRSRVLTATNMGIGAGVVATGIIYQTAKQAIEYKSLQQQLRANAQFTDGEFKHMIRSSENWASRTGQHVEDVLKSYRRFADVGISVGKGADQMVHEATRISLGTGASMETATQALRISAQTFGFDPGGRVGKERTASYLGRELHGASQVSGFNMEDLLRNFPRFAGIAQGVVGGKRGFQESLSMYSSLSRMMPPQQAAAVVTQLYRAIGQGGQSQRTAIENLAYQSGGKINLFDTMNQTAIHKHGIMPVLDQIRQSGLSPAEIRRIIPTVRGDLGALLQLSTQGHENFMKVSRIVDMSAAQQVRAGVQTPEQAFRRQQGTVAAGMGKLRENVHLIALDLGETLLPAINKLLGQLIPAIQRFRDWSKEHRELIRNVLLFTAGLGALSLAVRVVTVVVSPLATLFSPITWAVKTLDSHFKLLERGLKVVTIAWRILSIAFMMNPFVFIVVAIIAVIAVIILLYNKWGWFHDQVDKVGKFLQRFGIWLSTVFVSYFHKVINWIQNHWKTLLVIAVLSPVIAVIAGIVLLGPKIIQGIKLLLQSGAIGWIKDNWKGLLVAAVLWPLLGIIAGIALLGPKIVDVFKALLQTGVGKWIKDHWKTILITSVLAPFSPLLAAISAFAPQILQKGKDIAHTIISGFKNFWKTHNLIDWIVSQFTGIDLSGILGGIMGGGTGGAKGKFGYAPGAGTFGIRGARSESAGPNSMAGVPGAFGHTDIQVDPNAPFFLPGTKKSHYTLTQNYIGKGYGETLMFKTPNGGKVVYMHMDKVNPTLQTGKSYSGGTFLGLTGGVPGQAPGVTSQFSSGAHLHVGYDKAAYSYMFGTTGGRGFVQGQLNTGTNNYDGSTFSAYSTAGVGPGALKTKGGPQGLHRWLPLIHSAAGRSGVPANIIAGILMTESSGDPAAQSWNASEGVSDIGLMQYGPAEAKAAGGKYTKEPGANILTGAKYLRYIYDHFAHHSWPMAIAMYNAGIGYHGDPYTAYEGRVMQNVMNATGGAPAVGGALTDRTVAGRKGASPPTTGTGNRRGVPAGMPSRGNLPNEPVDRTGTPNVPHPGAHYEGQITIGREGHHFLWHSVIDTSTGKPTGQFWSEDLDAVTKQHAQPHYDGEITRGKGGHRFRWHAEINTSTGRPTGRYWSEDLDAPGPPVHLRPGEHYMKRGVEYVHEPAHRTRTGEYIPAEERVVPGQVRTVTDSAGHPVMERYIIAPHATTGRFVPIPPTPGQRRVITGAHGERIVQTFVKASGATTGRWVTPAQMKTAEDRRGVYLSMIDPNLNKLYPAHPQNAVNMTAGEWSKWLAGRIQYLHNEEQRKDIHALQQYRHHDIDYQQYRGIVASDAGAYRLAVSQARDYMSTTQYGGRATPTYQAYHIFQQEACRATAQQNELHKENGQFLKHSTDHLKKIESHMAEIKHALVPAIKKDQHKPSTHAKPSPHAKPKDPGYHGHLSETSAS